MTNLYSETERAEMVAGTVDLLDILTYARPHGSLEEQRFTQSHVVGFLKAQGLTDWDIDGFGNVWAHIAAPDGSLPSPRVLWSCHIDTVHAKGGRQEVVYKADGVTVGLRKQKPGRCLGADDGAGLWLLREMIAARVAGSYVFHRGEEVGRLGSRYVLSDEPERLKGFDACVAFDRKGTDNLITHQMGERGISRAFAGSMIDALSLSSRGLLAYLEDDSGSYTDSYSYFDTIPECCNMSVGYQGEHGPKETLDVLHAWRLRNALVRADFSGLVIERDPSEVEYLDWGYGSRNGSYGSGSYTGNYGRVSRTWDDRAWGKSGDDDSDRLVELCRAYPDTAAALLDGWGVSADDFCDELGVGSTGSVFRIMGAT